MVPSAPAGLSPQPGSAVWHWDLHTTLPGSKILFGPCQGGNAERQEDRLWEEHCRGSQGLTVQPAQMSQALGNPFFASAKLGSDVHSAFLTKLLFCVLST